MAALQAALKYPFPVSDDTALRSIAKRGMPDGPVIGRRFEKTSSCQGPKVIVSSLSR